ESGADERDDLVRPPGEVVPGDSDDAPAARHQTVVAVAVTIPIELGVVPPPTVDLDEEPNDRPGEVDAADEAGVVASRALALRPFDSGRVDDREEQRLELARGCHVAPIAIGEERAEQR